MRQAITLTGLGSEEFEKSASNMDCVFLAFSNHFKADTLEGRNAGMFESFRTIDSYTRYFDRPKPNSNPIAVAFTHFEDPYGILQSMEADGFMHTENNAVECRQRFVNGRNGTIT